MAKKNKKIDRRIFKKEGEELQAYLNFRKRGSKVESGKKYNRQKFKKGEWAMIKFKYSDLSDGSTMAYKTFDRHYKSFEARRKQLEREEAIMLGLTAKMQELGEITYDEYNPVIAWMVHSDKSWSEILWEVFENHKFPSIYENRGWQTAPSML